ncbi:MAG: flagellar motor protein MotB, partial [Alphaproteobacteria bacterium]|nr:flagellar motor protein MotB [Alphaproteobacteria bacterium]
MKRFSVSALALAAALVAAPVFAHADTTPGWYAGAGVGASFGVDPTMHTATGTHDAKFKSADAAFLGSVGYAWSNGLRLE